MRLISFVDLDDTLFSTRRKLPAHLQDTELEHVSVNTRGEAHGFRTAKQAALFTQLCRLGPVIPVTGRSAQAFARVRLPFSHARVLDHGATLLAADGAPDAVYAAQTGERLAQHARDFSTLAQDLSRQVRLHFPGLQVRLHEVHGQPLYLVVKHPQRQMGALTELAHSWQEQLGSDSRWHLFSNDSTLTLMQACVSKRGAVQHLQTTLDPRGEARNNFV